MGEQVTAPAAPVTPSAGTADQADAPPATTDSTAAIPDAAEQLVVKDFTEAVEASDAPEAKPDAAQEASEPSVSIDTAPAAPMTPSTGEANPQSGYYGDTYQYRIVRTGNVDEPSYAQDIEDALNASGAFGFRVCGTIETHGHVLVIMER